MEQIDMMEVSQALSAGETQGAPRASGGFPARVGLLHVDSNHAFLTQGVDPLWSKAGFGKHFVSMLAQVGRRLEIDVAASIDPRRPVLRTHFPALQVLRIVERA